MSAPCIAPSAWKASASSSATKPLSCDRPIVAARALAKAYGRGAPVWQDVDLAIQPGERVALIGANGAGKSTLLKCLIGLLPTNAGAVEALGERFERAPTARQQRRLRRQVGFVFQRHGLVKRQSVLSNVVHGMLGLPGGWRAWHERLAPAAAREAAMAALDDVRLAEKAAARADELSGGQSQRVAIARALVRRPRLLIADEPAASLDPTAGHEVMSLFASLAGAHGITLLFTSHDMEHAVHYSDRVVALKGGGVAFDRPSGAVTPAMLSEIFDAGP